jgi:hypothetical protein
MSLRELIYHKHYWSVPHGRAGDNKIIQICYDCGKERESPINLGPAAADQPSGRSQSQVRNAGDDDDRSNRDRH